MSPNDEVVYPNPEYEQSMSIWDDFSREGTLHPLPFSALHITTEIDDLMDDQVIGMEESLFQPYS